MPREERSEAAFRAAAQAAPAPVGARVRRRCAWRAPGARHPPSSPRPRAALAAGGDRAPGLRRGGARAPEATAGSWPRRIEDARAALVVAHRRRTRRRLPRHVPAAHGRGARGRLPGGPPLPRRGAVRGAGRDYVQRHPSRSYTLNRLGDHLPQFLPGRAGPPARGVPPRARPCGAGCHGGLRRGGVAGARPRAVRAVPRRKRWAGGAAAADQGLPSADVRLPGSPLARRGAAPGAAPAPVRQRQPGGGLPAALHRAAARAVAAGARAARGAVVRRAPLGEAVAVAAVGIRERRREDEIFKAFRTWVAEGMFSSIDL